MGNGVDYSRGWPRRHEMRWISGNCGDLDNTPDLGRAVNSFTKLRGLGKNVAGLPCPRRTQSVSLGLRVNLPFLGSMPDFVSPGTGQGLRGTCRRHQPSDARRGREKPGQSQRTGEESQLGSLAPPPWLGQEGSPPRIGGGAETRIGLVQDTHPRAACPLPLCAHFFIERIFNVTTSRCVRCFPNHFHNETKPEIVFLSGTLASSPSSSTASHLLINPNRACGLPSAF